MMSPKALSAARRCIAVPRHVQRAGAGRHDVALSRARRIATAAAVSRVEEAPVTIPTPPARGPTRRDQLKEARPFSDFLTDTFARQHDYLRISLTERCNLRCVYCMPEEGVPLSPQRELLTTPEIVMLSSVFVAQGVNKIRLTGGEPTIRRDILPLMQQIGALRPQGLRELCLTTNGIALYRKLEGMVEAGLTGVNLSLDTLDPWQFQIMTRRKGFDAVMKSIDRVLELNEHGAGIKLKINAVVMRGVNDREILPFVEMTREKDIEVRFIEYMPFDGNKWNAGKMLSYAEMLDVIRAAHPELEKLRGHRNDTSKTYQVPGFAGRIGFITSMTHNFCGSCNRLRITSDGNLKVCLFGNAEVSLRDILRRSNGGEPIDEPAWEAMRKIESDKRRGGIATGEEERELLDVIGMAVKRKKAKHAGIGELEHMKNRPMILIDPDLSLSSHNDHHTPGRVKLPTTSSFPPLRILTSPRHLFPLVGRATLLPPLQQLRCLSTTAIRLKDGSPADSSPSIEVSISEKKLTHVSDAGSAHMVSISDKTPTERVAKAVCSVHFSNPAAAPLVRENQMKKGDVLGVARVAGIMAAKRTADLIPLCHPIAISKVVVGLTVIDARRDPCGTNKGVGAESGGGGGDKITDVDTSRIDIEATVACEGRTGVEMEALTAASTAALTVYDMCKAVDKGMRIHGLRVVLKEGGKSGRWIEGVQE